MKWIRFTPDGAKEERVQRAGTPWVDVWHITRRGHAWGWSECVACGGLYEAGGHRAGCQAAER